LSSAFTTFVLGYHGCDAAVARDVIAGRRSLTASENDYDWLGRTGKLSPRMDFGELIRAGHGLT
jgi:hypothetical protein